MINFYLTVDYNGARKCTDNLGWRDDDVDYYADIFQSEVDAYLGSDPYAYVAYSAQKELNPRSERSQVLHYITVNLSKGDFVTIRLVRCS